MALTKFGFAFEVEEDLFDKVLMAKEVESFVFAQLSKNDYGTGVKNVAIGVIVMDSKHARAHPIRQPVYRPGKWKSRSLPLEFEDTLEFDIKPPLEEMRSAVNVVQLAKVIHRALGFAFPALRKVEIPNFDINRFMVDLDDALRTFGMTPSI